jgi:hypothetical protein
VANNGFAERGSLIVWVGGDKEPTAAEWDPYVTVVARQSERALRTKKPLFVLVVADSGAPSAQQREQVVKAGVGAPSRTALLSSSPVARGVITVFSWFNFNMKAFAPKDVMKACAFIEIAAADVKSVWLEVERVEAGLDQRVRAVKEAAPFVR